MDRIKSVGFSIVLVLLSTGAASVARAEILADSVKDFSGEQGRHGWSYGYWDESTDPDAVYDQTGDLWYLEDGRYYTSLWAEGGHPHGDMDLGSYARAKHWAVRRWISPVSGRVQIRGHAGKVMPWGENWRGGCVFHIVVDGERIFDAEVADGGQEYSVIAEVAEGSTVDFLIGPGTAIGVMRFTAGLSRREP